MQRARLVSMKNNVIPHERAVGIISSAEDQIKRIHNYFVTLQNIFHKNKNLILKRTDFKKSLSNSRRIEISTTKNSYIPTRAARNYEEIVRGEVNQKVEANFRRIKNGEYKRYSSRYYLKTSERAKHSSAPSIKQEPSEQKEGDFIPIGERFRQIQEKQKGNSRAITKLNTSVHFHPQNGSKQPKQLIPTMGLIKHLKRDRKQLLKAETSADEEFSQFQQLNSSHKSVYSYKSEASRATKSSEIPCPW